MTNDREKLKARCKRMEEALKKQPMGVLLFGNSKILNGELEVTYAMNKVVELHERCKFRPYIFYILCRSKEQKVSSAGGMRGMTKVTNSTPWITFMEIDVPSYESNVANGVADSDDLVKFSHLILENMNTLYDLRFLVKNCSGHEMNMN